MTALIFDLDGTLVQTETLKAESYFRVLSRLDASATRDAVFAGYAAVVGRSSEEVVEALVARFALASGYAETLGAHPGEAPWQTLYRVRKAEYERMLNEEPEALKAARCPHNTAVLAWGRESGRETALATMSRQPQVDHVLDVLGLSGFFDSVATRDDVSRGKPDPEIYQLTFERLGVAPADALILEDSPSGARAAIASGARVLVVVNDLTRVNVTAAGLEGEVAGVVESDAALLDRVREVVGAR